MTSQLYNDDTPVEVKNAKVNPNTLSKLNFQFFH
jgi:hypothetical protein